MEKDLDHVLLEVAKSGVQCNSAEDLQNLLTMLVSRALPHQGALFIVAQRWQEKVTLTHALSFGYPEAARQNAMRVDSIGDRLALQHWLLNWQPLVIDLPEDRARVSALEAAEIEEFGLGRIAAHGVLDPAREIGSYMTFAGIDRSLPRANVEKALKLLTPWLHLALMQVLSTQQRLTKPSGGPSPMLTDVEQELVGWMARGLTNADMARLRCRSVHTVRNQLAVLFKKLGASNRAEALARARGLLRYGPSQQTQAARSGS